MAEPGASDGCRWASTSPSNIWLGVSAVEDQRWADIRIPALLDAPAAVRFISAEPLLGAVDLSRWLGGLHYRWRVRARRPPHGPGLGPFTA